MGRPTDKEEKQFNDLGVFFLQEKSISDIRQSGEKWTGVQVEIAVEDNSPVTAPDFSFSILNKRGVATVMTDWSFDLRPDTGQKVLSFTAWQRTPDAIDVPEVPSGLYMTFLDLCFYAGNEAVPENFTPDTFTIPSANYKATDLGWYYPSRFIDSVIDALGKLNDIALAAQMKEAILYTLP